MEDRQAASAPILRLWFPQALGDVPSEQPPEPRDASGDDGNERRGVGSLGVAWEWSWESTARW